VFAFEAVGIPQQRCQWYFDRDKRQLFDGWYRDNGSSFLLAASSKDDQKSY
jgi:hypothetical protein